MKHCNNNCKECNFAIKETYYIKPPFEEKEIEIVIGCERDNLKKPNVCGDTTLYYECPNCHNEINYYETYCHKCNQAIDWSD